MSEQEFEKMALSPLDEYPFHSTPYPMSYVPNTDPAWDDGYYFLAYDLETGVQVLGLAEDGVGYAVDEYNESLITDEMSAAVEEAKAQIISGEIEVHDYTSDDSCPVLDF